MMTTFARVFLALNGLGFLYLGAMGLWDPAGLLPKIAEIELTTPTALAEGRATYGGAMLTLGLYFLVGSMSRPQIKTALMVLAIFVGGLAGGRLLGAVLDGPASSTTLIALLVETVVTALAILLRRRVKDDTF